jgi:hypothetical protein
MGRRKGVPNRATADARYAIALFVDTNACRLQEWLDAVANGVREPLQEGGEGPGKLLVPPNPQKAFELFQSVVEYHIPKLARTELTGADGGAVKTVTTIEIKAVDP